MNHSRFLRVNCVFIK